MQMESSAVCSLTVYLSQASSCRFTVRVFSFKVRKETQLITWQSDLSAEMTQRWDSSISCPDRIRLESFTVVLHSIETHI